MSVFESIADRQIRAAQKAGLFDNLSGTGEPIADLDQERPPGWFAANLIRRERSKIRAEELDVEIRHGVTHSMRSKSEAELQVQVRRLNDSIVAYNESTHWLPRKLLDADFVAAEWRRVRSEL